MTSPTLVQIVAESLQSQAEAYRQIDPAYADGLELAAFQTLERGYRYPQPTK